MGLKKWESNSLFLTVVIAILNRAHGNWTVNEKKKN